MTVHLEYTCTCCIPNFAINMPSAAELARASASLEIAAYHMRLTGGAGLASCKL